MEVDKGKTNQPIRSTYQSFVQTVLCGTAALPLLTSGTTLGFSAVALPFMLQPNDDLHVNQNQASWIASLATITTPFGCLLSGPIIDRFGRRNALLYLNIPSVIGWMLIGIRPNIVQMYIGRLLTGLSLGLTSIPSSVYLAEGSSPDIRGFMGTFGSIGISLGVELAYIMGLIFKEKWQLTAILSGVLPILFSIIIWFLPESPVWLMQKGRYDDACLSLMKLRHTKVQTTVQDELDQIAEKARSSRTQSLSFRNALKTMLQPRAYKPLLLMNFFFFFQQVSGSYVVMFYAVDVVREAGVTSDPYLVAVFIGLARLVVTLFAAWLSNRFGRRKCTIASGGGMSVALGALAAYLWRLDSNSYDHTFQHPLDGTAESGSSIVSSLFPASCLLLFIALSTVGFLTVPWTMIGEMYPSEVRGVAAGFTTCCLYIVSFIMLKLYPTMLDAMNKHGLFMFYAAMSLLGTLFITIFLPETQGKTLTEIEEYFSGKKSKKKQPEQEEMLDYKQVVTITPSK